jgi:hypothetical protein
MGKINQQKGGPVDPLAAARALQDYLAEVTAAA